MGILAKYAFVYFVCEGKNEEAVLRWIVEKNCLELNAGQYSFDFIRARGSKSWKALEQNCFEYEYDGEIAIVYLLDSKSEKRNCLKSKTGKQVPVIKVLTPPEIEILLILAYPEAEREWNRQYRRKRQLKPSEFCRQYYQCDIKNGDNFINAFESFEQFVSACQVYKSRHANQYCIYDILR